MADFACNDRDLGSWPCLLDGELHSLSETRVPAGSDAVLLGRAVFTTGRVRDGRFEFCERHIQRLLDHARGARLTAGSPDGELPGAASLIAGAERMGEALGSREVVLRVTLLAAQGTSEGGVSTLWTARPLRSTDKSGVRLCKQMAVAERGRFEALKHTGRLAKLIEREAALARGFYDAVGVARDGEVLDGCTGSLVWVRGGQAYATELGGGLLDSLARAVLLDEGELQVGRLWIDDLDDLEELLWINAVQGVVGVREFEGMERLLPGSSGLEARRLSAHFEALARGSA